MAIEGALQGEGKGVRKKESGIEMTEEESGPSQRVRLSQTVMSNRRPCRGLRQTSARRS
jgi:hypothetical protein